MKRLLIFVAVLALALTACGGTGGGGDVAATVDDSEVTVEDVRAFPYEAEGTIETAEFTQYLTALIQWRILDDAAAEEFDIDPSDEEIEGEMEEVLANQTDGMSLEEVAEAQNFSEDTMRRIIRVGLIQEQVAERLGEDASDPSDEEVQAALQQQEAGLTEVCARHVLVESAEEAETARERLEDGEDFETVAEELSVDPSAAENGGDLGCAPAQQYDPAFAEAAVEAEIDAITEPVQSQFGFHVLQVYDRTGPSDEELPSEDDIRDSLSQNAGMEALQEWLLEKLEEAEVSVDEEYGEWVTEPQPMVQAPSEGSATTAPAQTPDQ